MTRHIFDDPDLQQRVQQHGFVEMPVLTTAEVAALLEAMAELDPADGYAPEGQFHCSFRDERNGYKRAAQALLIDAFARFMAASLPEFRILSANFYVKPPGTGELPAHQNWPVLDLDDTTLTIWCPLVDCDVKNGTLHVVPGSHKLVPYIETPRAPPYCAQFVSTLIEDHVFEPLPTRAGNGVIFDDSLLHWSPDNQTNQPRIAVQLLCVPIDAQPMFFFLDGDRGFDRIAVGQDFFLDHSYAMLTERQPEWRSLGHVANRNRLIGEKEFTRLLTRRRRARAPRRQRGNGVLGPLQRLLAWL